MYQKNEKEIINMTIIWKKYDLNVSLKTGCYLTLEAVSNLDKFDEVYEYIKVSDYYEKDTL